MNSYEKEAFYELKEWQIKMEKKPSFANRISKSLQTKANNLIPEKVHVVITEAIKNMVKAVLVGSKFTTKKPMTNASLEDRENLVNEKLNFYKKTAAASGAGTGAGGIILGLADFPLLLSLKMKFLFDTASLYGFDVKDYKERVYILYIFLLAFSSDKKRLEIYQIIMNWDKYKETLPKDLDLFNWRNFQQEYRDYMDIAKMLQLVPGIGAVVGAYANYQLVEKLGKTSVNAYRLRVFKKL
ncbi:EcsC family protein [Haloimpatiens sp. FM7330]|uniref:EcsC family protein n=1 Tax=Haloimpatiens sp. FM7330 TaxID=3298610 RepID=UPI00363F14D3